MWETRTPPKNLGMNSIIFIWVITITITPDLFRLFRCTSLDWTILSLAEKQQSLWIIWSDQVSIPPSITHKERTHNITPSIRLIQFFILKLLNYKKMHTFWSDLSFISPIRRREFKDFISFVRPYKPAPLFDFRSIT